MADQRNPTATIPPSSGRKVQAHELCDAIVVTRTRPTRVDRPETKVTRPPVWGIPQPHLLPVWAPANSRGTDPYCQTAPGNEVTSADVSLGEQPVRRITGRGGIAQEANAPGKAWG